MPITLSRTAAVALTTLALSGICMAHVAPVAVATATAAQSAPVTLFQYVRIARTSPELTN